MAKLIETHEISKYFDDFLAVDHVSLHVEAGEILALLGPNGAGKTTTIRMLASILEPSEGEAYIAGFDVRTHATEVRRRIGLLTEHHGLYTRMKAADYLLFFGRTYGFSDDWVRERASLLLDVHGLAGVENRRLGEFSKGMRQKLALVRALLHDPSILLLDEPTSAMDPASARQVREQICALKSAERAVIVCTHNLQEAEMLADRIMIIAEGKIVAQGTVPQLKQNLLGDPIMEIRFKGSIDGVVRALPDRIELVSQGEDWIQYRTKRPEMDNPHILNLASRLHLSVITLSEVGRSLEEVYLQVVGANGAHHAE